MASPWRDLTRLPDRSVMCCICFEWRTRDELFRDKAGQLWDVCPGCAVDAFGPTGQPEETT